MDRSLTSLVFSSIVMRENIQYPTVLQSLSFLTALPCRDLGGVNGGGGSRSCGSRWIGGRGGGRSCNCRSKSCGSRQVSRNGGSGSSSRCCNFVNGRGCCGGSSSFCTFDGCACAINRGWFAQYLLAVGQFFADAVHFGKAAGRIDFLAGITGFAVDLADIGRASLGTEGAAGDENGQHAGEHFFHSLWVH